MWETSEASGPSFGCLRLGSVSFGAAGQIEPGTRLQGLLLEEQIF